MSEPFQIVIVGAGPAGLSAALAIAKHPSTSSSRRPVRVTVLELRNSVQTIGGAVNMTPLALRYLDAIGAGERLRPRGHAASAIEMIAHRTGRLLATLWPDVDALRVRRQDVVESLTEAALSDVDPEVVKIIYGAKLQSLEEQGDDDAVRVTYTSGGNDTSIVINADLVLGCDGIHSLVRRQLVEPERPETYTGKCVAYGFIPASAADAARWTRAGGELPLVQHTTLVQHGAESLLLAYYEPEAQKNGLYLAAVMPVEASGDEADNRAGWKVQGADKEGLRRKIQDMFAGGGIACLEEIVARCDDWFFYPVHMLPEGGAWSKGRVLLLGDAAHAMPPQGESTGVAIEDGVLLAHVLSRRDAGRSVPRMLADYEALRRGDIAALHKTSMARWTSPAAPKAWIGRVFMEYVAWAVVSYLNWTSNHFGRDVRDLPLPE